MSATAARTTTKTPAAVKGGPLPPARSFAKQTRATGRTFTRVGGKQLRGERQRFALPKEFRRSAANHSAVPAFSSQANPVLVDTVISGARFFDNLAQRENTRQAVALHPWQQDITGAHKRPPTVIQFAQLPQNTVVVPPALPLRRAIGKAVATHELKKFDSLLTTSTGSPLPVAVRNPLARTFSVDLTPIRVHTDAGAQRVVRSLNTRAFAYGNHIFLGPGEQPTDLRLMAHEVAHVVQQAGGVTLQHFTQSFGDPLEHEAERASAAAVRGERFNVQHSTSPRPQGLLKEIGIDIDIPDPLDWLAGKANMINGFRMFTIVLGVNPINMSKVDRSAANILRALIEFLPGGGFITQALDSSGVFEKAGTFVEQQIKSLGMTGEAIKSAVTQFIDRLSLKRIVLEPGTVWEEAKSIFSVPIDRIISFASGLVGGIIDLIKEAILKPIAKLAEGTEGYNLLKGILGEDPITGESVTPSAETLLGPLLNMIGLGDVWQKMQQAKATSRAWAWFKTTMSQLRSFVSQIPGLFIAAFKALTIEDIVLVPKAFGKLRSIFGGFIGKFVSWGLEAMFKLLEIVFDVVKPGAMGYVKKTGAALKNILQNPLPFVGNLARAAKLGFTNFGSNFLTHLKKGLIDWLTGSLEGVYIPTALSLPEFGKLALSILGITWGQIRAKIVKALGPGGETIMNVLETTFDIVVALVTGGPAAAWELIKDKLTELKDTIVQGIISFVTETVVTKAIPKLIAMFIPGAGFISAIVSIYDIVKTFIEKLSKIAQVISAFVNSIVAIAAGNIGAAAAKVESVLGGLLSLAISFLAGFVGLGKVTSKVKEVINQVRARVDKALDAGVNWVVAQVRRLGGMIKGKDARTPAEKQRDLAKAVRELRPRVRELFRRGPPGRLFSVRLAVWKRQYKLNELKVTSSGSVIATINPTDEVDTLVPHPKQAALAVVVSTITNYFASTDTPAAAAAVLATGAGTRESPYDPAAAGMHPVAGVRAILLQPGGAPGETSIVMGTHAGRPVTAIIQRPNVPKSPGQGEGFMFNPVTGRRVPIGAYPRSLEVPGVSPAPPPTGRTAAENISDPFVRGGAPPSGSLATGYSEELSVEGRVGSQISVHEAQAAGGVMAVQAMESVRVGLGAVTIPSQMQSTTRGATPIAATLGGPQAAKGSARDWRLGAHAISRTDPQTGLLLPAGTPAPVVDPSPKGVKSPSRPGSQRRAGAQLNMSVQALAGTILDGMVTGDVVLITSTADIDRIRDRTLAYLQQHYPRPR